MPKTSQSICLNMIVKNEESIIQRCFDSLKFLIDYWVIVDTGSTDGTQKVIREYFQDIPGELIEKPWVNFAHNRSEALEYARGKSDYLLIIDADEYLEFEPGFSLPELIKDAYYFEVISSGVNYYKVQLVNNALNWCFKNVVHEYIYSPNAQTEEILTGVKTIRAHRDGARARDPKTYRRDALILENALLDEPDNSRYVFYLAQSYRDANEPELAIKNYQKRAKMGGWIEEVWYSLYQIGVIKQSMGKEWAEVLEAYLIAYQYKSDRSEPLYKIGLYYRLKQDFYLAYLFLSQAIKISYPEQDRLFIEKHIYDYLIALEYAVCCFYVGNHAEAIATNNRLLADKKLPVNIAEQIIINRQFSLEVLYPKMPGSLKKDNKIKVCVVVDNFSPDLDKCVESLLSQEYQNSEIILINDGYSEEFSIKIPAKDKHRFRVFSNPTRQGWFSSLHQCLIDYCQPDEIIFSLNCLNWLADNQTLSAINQFFNNYDCLVMYGQYCYASGERGLTMPLVNLSELENLGKERHFLSPFIFRGSLYYEVVKEDPEHNFIKDNQGELMTEKAESMLNYALLRKAGLNSSRFSDRVLTICN